METIKIDSLEHIKEAAHQFVSLMGDNTVFAFYGKMGAGKTTFIKAIGLTLQESSFIILTSIALRSWKRYMTWAMRITSIVAPSVL